MRTFTTQMEAAKAGQITEEMKVVARKEGMDVIELMSRMAKGEIVIPCNRLHSSIKPAGIGRNLKTKINVNLGTSGDHHSWEEEMEKVSLASYYEADSIMDLSTGKHTSAFRRELVKKCSMMIGSVPAYDIVHHRSCPLKEMTARHWLEVVEEHAKDGVDFMTIHCGLRKKTIDVMKASGRVTNVVSRGGSLLFAWMEMTGEENPFYTYFNQILELCRAYDVTLSLGDACRSGCIQDGTDESQIDELLTLAALTKRAWEQDVQVIVEGPGHLAINEISTNIALEESLCQRAPFYVLGPIVTDVAPGYDHITAAIGGSIAAAHGASFLCYVTPSEHLRLPTYEDVKEGIIAAKIAAHAGDIAKGIPQAKEWDLAMSRARQSLDWGKMFSYAIDQERPRQYRKESMPESDDTCTMCGEFCALKTMNQIINGNEVALQ